MCPWLSWIGGGHVNLDLRLQTSEDPGIQSQIIAVFPQDLSQQIQMTLEREARARSPQTRLRCWDLIVGLMKSLQRILSKGSFLAVMRGWVVGKI